MATLPGGIKIKGDLPSWKEKRALLADRSVPAEALVALGKLLEGTAAYEEAAAFYGRASANGELERLRGQAVENGDGFLWLTACRQLGALPFPTDEGRQLAERAESRGRLFDARLVFDAIEDAEQLARIEALIPTALPVKTVEQEVAEAVEDFEATHPDDGDGGPDDEGSQGSQGVARMGG